MEVVDLKLPVLILGLSLTVVYSYTLAADADAETELIECAALIDDVKRLECYDALFTKSQEDELEQDQETTPPEPDNVPVEEEKVVEKRVEQAKKTSRNWFAITPYRSNYVLPLTHNSRPNVDSFRSLRAGTTMDEVEAKFQLSFQFDLWKNMFDKDVDLYFAYTQLAFWQVYNTQASSPFRETNYEPEAGLIFHSDFNIFGLNNHQIRFGVVHQSNGRAEPLSRSWNRIFGMFMFERGRFSSVLRPWYRIPEDEEDDDNPDIEDFLGHFEWYSSYKWRDHTIGVLLRNNLKTSENRGAVRLDLSYPLTDRLKLYLQYFNGYGESLIDYNHANNRIGVGLILTEWQL